MRAKQQVCETVQLLITEAVCGYRRLTGQMLRFISPHFPDSATLSEGSETEDSTTCSLTHSKHINLHNVTCYDQKKDSQHMEDPGNHDSVHSHSCGSCSSSHSQQGSLQQTQGWNTGTQHPHEHEPLGGATTAPVDRAGAQWWNTGGSQVKPY